MGLHLRATLLGIMDNHDEDFPERNPELAFEVGKDLVDVQLQAVDSLDNKAGVVFGFGGAILAIPLAVLALDSSSRDWPVLHLLLGGGFAYLGCAALSLISLLPRDWGAGPPLQELWDYSRDEAFTNDDMKWWAAEVYKESFEKNESPLKVKGYQVFGAMAMLAIQTALMAGALMAALGD